MHMPKVMMMAIAVYMMGATVSLGMTVGVGCVIYMSGADSGRGLLWKFSRGRISEAKQMQSRAPRRSDGRFCRLSVSM